MVEPRLANRVAVVTGGANGIGEATVERFLSEGAKVVIADMNEVQGAELVTRLEGDGYRGKLEFVQVDVSQESDVVNMIRVAKDKFGGVDILFNNAGIVGAIGPILETDVEHWDETFAVMSRGVFLGIKHGGRAMQDSGRGGSIINTASIAALSAGGGPLVYSATKAAVVSITQNAAAELAQYHIRVNAICPGVIFTRLMHRGNIEEAERTAREIQPLPINGEPHHIASAALYLASDDSAFVTGEAHLVDGGYLANSLLNVHPLPGVSRQPTYTGMTYGNTGQKPDVRFLKDKQ